MYRRSFLAAGLAAILTVALGPVTAQTEYSLEKVQRWGIFELSLKGPANDNCFVDVEFGARFKHKDQTVAVTGFYDGEGSYRIRFMPNKEGLWNYVTSSNHGKLDNKTGKFICVPASGGNHGPVKVYNKYHFAYADGTPYLPFGTTCYAWTHQSEKLQDQTLKTLREAPFNKLRMCVLPKYYPYNRKEPLYYPFEKDQHGKWDFSRFNCEFFRHLEKRVEDLQRLGIEADLILFHPYDRGHWGFDNMGQVNDNRYLRYVIARLAAYRNVWWSMANEYDLVKTKTMDDWERLLDVVAGSDPYKRLCSVHNGGYDRIYDPNNPQISHASIQNWNLKNAKNWRLQFKKPVIVDECEYEGDIEEVWGNISAEELVHRFWLGSVAGCYVGHGETYRHPEDIIWWSKGGVLRGKSAARIAFLRQIMQDGPPEGIEPIGYNWKWRRISGGKNEDRYYLIYFGAHQPKRFSSWTVKVPSDHKYNIDIIDTWNMKIRPLKKLFDNNFEIELPGKPYMAVRIRRDAK